MEANLVELRVVAETWGVVHLHFFLKYSVCMTREQPASDGRLAYSTIANLNDLLPAKSAKMDETCLLVQNRK